MSPRRIRASLATGLLATAVAGVAAPAALACSCVPPSPATVNAADVVFTGTVTAESDPGAGSPVRSSIHPVTYTLAVDAELKGDVEATARVVTARDSASCGVDFEVGMRYLVVADRDDAGDLRTGLCQGTQALPAGRPLPEFARGLGTPTPAPPVPPATDAIPWPAPSRVSQPAEGTGAPELAVSPAGEAILAWERTTDADGERLAASRLLAARRPAGGTFGVPEAISADGELAVGGAVAAAGDSQLAVWVRLGASGPAVVARARSAGAPWDLP